MHSVVFQDVSSPLAMYFKICLVNLPRLCSRDRITLAVLEMSEKEELAKLEKKWWYDKGECPDRTYKKVSV
jgi:hypothetical protein